MINLVSYVSNREYGLEWLGSGAQGFLVKVFPLALSILSMCSNTYAKVDLSENEAAIRSKFLVEEWVKVERSVSREAHDWTKKRATLNKLMALYQVELEQIKEELDAAGESLVNFDKEALELKRVSTELKVERQKVDDKTKEQCERLLGLMAFFPRPLLDQVAGDKMVIQSQDSQLRERVLGMLNVLKAAGKFNQSVTYADETILIGGMERQVKVLYLGFGIAYYMSGDLAGVGMPAKGGWQWRPEDDIQPAVSKAIAVYQKITRPELVSLPVEVQK